MARLWDKIRNKNIWIYWAVLVVTILLFENFIGNWIQRYIQLPEIILRFISIILIVIVVDLIGGMILKNEI